MACTRKRRLNEPLAGSSTEIPEKTQRRDDDSLNGNGKGNAAAKVHHVASSCFVHDQQESYLSVERPRQEEDERLTIDHLPATARITKGGPSLSPCEILNERSFKEYHDKNQWRKTRKGRQEGQRVTGSPTTQTDSSGRSSRRDESARLRKTIQWLEEGARRLREDLANARNELHEERRASKLIKREMESNVKEARANEAAKYQHIIAELKTRISRSTLTEPTTIITSTSSLCPSFSSSSSSLSSTLRAEIAREENHRREISALKKRLGEAEKTIRKLKWESLNSGNKPTCTGNGPSRVEVRRLEAEVHCLRVSNEKLEEKLRIAIDAEKIRTNELRIQHENHEVELAALRKSLRSETIKMMEELRGKNREIEKLSKLVYTDDTVKRRKSAAKDDDEKMRKLRENERNGGIRSMGRLDRKILLEDASMMDSYLRDVGCDKAMSETQVERLREVALEQQQVIEILRQALKEKERKLEQLSNKRRKEEFYRQWLELEPVAEVDDEEDHDEGDSALSSAPSSLSPQPGGCGQWQNNNFVSREAYDTLLMEMEDLRVKLMKEKEELSYATSQVADLEKALLEETRCGGREKEINSLNEKLREAEEREACLMAELSDLREQNELLEFRLLELEETPARRDSPDHAADSGVVSPEPMHVHKEETNKQRNRAVATVIPYNTSNNISALSEACRVASPIPHKPPLSLQESGIFEQDEVEVASRGTQTEVPAGELLQEVQRLQELRARLQERVSKVSTPAVCAIDMGNEPMTADSILHLSTYQERIRDLEERLETYEEADEKRVQEKILSKQREEELLDENYKLTERVYWLENELQNLEDIIAQDRCKEERRTDDGETMIWTVYQPSRDTTDSLTTSLASSKMDQSTQSLPMHHRTSCNCHDDDREKNMVDFAQQCTLLDNDQVTVVDGSEENSLMTGIVEEIAREAKEVGDEIVTEETDEESKVRRERMGRQISQVLVFPEEPEVRAIDPTITSDESEPGKKVRQRGKDSSEREGWVMRASNGSSRSGIISWNTFRERVNHRLVLYQEICV